MEITNGLAKELIAIIKPDGRYLLDWEETTRETTQERAEFEQNLYQTYQSSPERAWFLLGSAAKPPDLSASFDYMYQIAATFVRELVRNPDLETLREKAIVELEPETAEALLLAAPFLIGAEHLDHSWLLQGWKQLNQGFVDAISQMQGSIAEYLLKRNPAVHLAGKVYFHLVESSKEEYPFAFLATYAAEPSATGKAKHLPLKNALQEYGQNSQKLLQLLATVNQAASQSPLIAELVESGELFHPIGFTTDEAYTFLKEVPLYEAAGILCRLPNWWRKKSVAPRVAITLGAKSPANLGMDTLVDFDVELALGDVTLTAEEMQRLLAESDGLAFIKGRWVEIQHEQLQATLAAYEQARKMARQGELTIMEAMRLQLTASQKLNLKEISGEIEVTQGEWLSQVLAQLKMPETIAPVDCGAGFSAVLREYQQRGLGWLAMMKQMGFGACLADDMGLGKTIQVIALLNHSRAVKSEKVLLVVPASLIGNWTAELNRFAPQLPYYVVHPQANKSEVVNQEVNSGIYITTYGMLLRLEWLKQVCWDLVILDEAQAIKNPGTKQTKTVKQLQARCRIAMTGTPVENRLADLWSIFDFLNQGLLGTAKEFTSFTKKLQENTDGYGRLKQVVAPFILRRLKTDRRIITDLPEKIEMKTYASLTKKQAVLYSAAVTELKSKLDNSAGIERKGLVLGALIKFKQICNHPAQYLGQEDYAEMESGKYARLREICETIYEKRERVLVFTQFKEITGPLALFLKTIFQHEGLVLHGETPVAKRQELVARFQGQQYVPFMVLSIKAGGVGLNLTAANHVVHFDRWWNPAVENQATDRAFRIGQQKNVIVHKFITQGTLEEKIDAMIEAKTKIAQEIVPDMQESWITELDNQQLIELFQLSM